MSDFLFLYFALIEISCTWGRRGEKSPFWKFCGCFKIRRRFFKFNDYSNWKMETFLCVYACADDFQLNVYPSSTRYCISSLFSHTLLYMINAFFLNSPVSTPYSSYIMAVWFLCLLLFSESAIIIYLLWNERWMEIGAIVRQ